MKNGKKKNIQTLTLSQEMFPQSVIPSDIPSVDESTVHTLVVHEFLCIYLKY